MDGCFWGSQELWQLCVLRYTPIVQGSFRAKVGSGKAISWGSVDDETIIAYAIAMTRTIQQGQRGWVVEVFPFDISQVFLMVDLDCSKLAQEIPSHPSVMGILEKAEFIDWAVTEFSIPSLPTVTEWYSHSGAIRIHTTTRSSNFKPQNIPSENLLPTPLWWKRHSEVAVWWKIQLDQNVSQADVDCRFDQVLGPTMFLQQNPVPG